MRSYECYLYLESILNKIEKIVEPNSQITPNSLGEEWKRLPYLDHDSVKTKKQYELILSYVERLRSRDGVVAISPGFKNKYFCSFLKAAHQNQLAGHEIRVGNDGFFDIIYAYQHGIIALSYSDYENTVGHDGLADRMGIPSGKLREQYMVGGGIKFDGEKLITSELSGHYGHLWTNELRQSVCDLIAAATGLEVEHEVRYKTVTFSSAKSEAKPRLQPYAVNYSSCFFNSESDTHSIIKQNNHRPKAPCILL